VEIRNHHRPAVLTDVCLVRGEKNMDPVNFEVESLGSETFENRSRIFYLDEAKGSYLLGLPQPFPISDRWPARVYEPVLSRCSSKRQAGLYCLLYDASAFRRIASVYRRPPHQWTSEDWHPYLAEAQVGTELGLMTQSLYGLETVNRVGLTCHPCAAAEIYLFTAMDHSTWQVPVYQNVRENHSVDDIITELHKDWWRNGHGKIVCGLCIFDRASTGYRLHLLTRSEYIEHHREVHYVAIVTVGTFSATGHHIRTYIAHHLYVLALAGRAATGGKDQPEAQATRKQVLQKYKTRPSDILTCLMENRDKKARTVEAAGREDIPCLTIDEAEMEDLSGDPEPAAPESPEDQAPKEMTFDEELDEAEKSIMGH
jgi:hypothetical protein